MATLEQSIRNAASRPRPGTHLQAYLSHRRRVQNSITIGSMLFYAGMLAGLGLLLSGAGWPLAAACVLAGLAGGFYFAHVRPLRIDRLFGPPGSNLRPARDEP